MQVRDERVRAQDCAQQRIIVCFFILSAATIIIICPNRNLREGLTRQQLAFSRLHANRVALFALLVMSTLRCVSCVAALAALR